MTNSELRAKIVEMLNCEELHELEKYWYDANNRVTRQALERYEEVISFILWQLDTWNND